MLRPIIRVVQKNYVLILNIFIFLILRFRREEQSMATALNDGGASSGDASLSLSPAPPADTPAVTAKTVATPAAATTTTTTTTAASSDGTAAPVLKTRHKYKTITPRPYASSTPDLKVPAPLNCS